MKFITKFDIILIVILFIGIFSFNFLFFKATNVVYDNAKVVVYYKDEVYKTFPLDVDKKITISTEIGENTIEISDNYVKMIDADCKDKYCVNESHIHYNNQTIVCLPNKIVVTIISSESSEIDSIVR